MHPYYEVNLGSTMLHCNTRCSHSFGSADTVCNAEEAKREQNSLDEFATSVCSAARGVSNVSMMMQKWELRYSWTRSGALSEKQARSLMKEDSMLFAEVLNYGLW